MFTFVVDDLAAELTAIIFSTTNEARKIIVEPNGSHPSAIHSDEPSIERRLAEFGVTKSELLEIVRSVVAARAGTVDDDPLSAEGLFAYIFGTRTTRQVFGAHGWRRHRRDNVEAIRHPDYDLSIIYQSVDRAADRNHIPQAISGKGSGADRLIAAGQASFFDELIPTDGASSVTSGPRGVWFFCVSVEGDDIRAELSLPATVAGGNFAHFVERIFILREGDWNTIRVNYSDDSDAVDVEPIVTRK